MANALTAEMIAELRKAAESATPGPWYTTGSPWFRSGDGVLCGSPDGNIAYLIADCDNFTDPRDEYDGPFKLADADDDAAFIAAANPVVILALLDEREKMVRALKFYRDNWQIKTNKRYGGLEYSPKEALLDDCGNIARAALPTE